MEKKPEGALGRQARGRGLVLQYSACFALTSLLVFFWFYAAGRTFVWEADGLKQHYRALVYAADYLRTGLGSLFAGRGLRFPQWSFALGEGGDVLNSLHYYAFGDPFCLGAVLVPARYMYVYYSLSVVLRLYCAGLAYLYLCRQTGQRSRVGILAGSLLYVFCYWGLRNANRHPFFLNPMIYFPLLLAGVERVLRDRGPTVLILSVFAAAVSNFYFFYMHAALTALYAVLRLIALDRGSLRRGLAHLGRLMGAAVLGAAMGAVILAPIVYAFLHDVRTGADNARHLLYPLGYYLKLPHMLLDTESAYWLCLGIGAPALIAMLLLLRRGREKRFLLLLLGLGVLFLLFPIFGQALNGFAYIANRWCWAFALLAAWLVTDLWDRMMELTPKEARFLAAGLGLYTLLCLACYDTNRFKTLGPLALAALFLLVLWPRKRPGPLVRRLGRQRLALAVVILSLFYNAFARYAPFFWAYAKEGLKAEDLVSAMTSDETAGIRALAAAEDTGDFYRYSGRSLTENAGFNAGLSGTQYYFSLSSPGVSRARRFYGVNEALTSLYMGYDDRAALLATTGVRYYARPLTDDQPVPPGFTATGVQSGGYEIFRSDNALPMGAVYDSWITEAELESLSFTQRQALLLQTLVTDRPVEGLSHWSGRPAAEQLAARMQAEDPDVVPGEGCFTVTRAGAEVRFLLAGTRAGETLLELRGLEFEGVPEYQLYFGPDRYDPAGRYGRAEWEQLSAAVQRRLYREDRYGFPLSEVTLTLTTDGGGENILNYYTPDYNFYNGRHDFAVNLHQSETPVREVTLRFSLPGIYRFDSLEFWVQPLEELAEQTAALGAEHPEPLRVEGDLVTGEITLTRPGLLCLPIPNSDGWTAEVDGAPAELWKANVKYLALALPAGSHSIRLRYERPLGRLGWAVSLGAWLGFGALVLVRFLLRKRKNRGIVKENN